MSEEIKQEQAVEQAPAVEENTTEETAFDPKEALDTIQALKAQLETQKKEIAGLNRKNSEDQGKLKELQMQHMSEEEKRQAQMLEMQNALANQYKENSLLKSGIPLELAGLIKGNSKDEIDSNVSVLAEFRKNIESSNLEKQNQLTKELEELRLKTKATGEPRAGSSVKIDRKSLSIDEAMALARQEGRSK